MTNKEKFYLKKGLTILSLKYKNNTHITKRLTNIKKRLIIDKKHNHKSYTRLVRYIIKKYS